MGLDFELVKLLLTARRWNVHFHRTLTLGRQHYFVGNKETLQLFKEFGLDPRPAHDLLAQKPPRYSEGFWRALGVERLETLDASDFEGATIVHDLNQPVPDSLKGRFDAVVDAGTLEHVFHFPVAIANCMQLVRVGGHLILYTPANNYFGHGFYQFSPEVFYRVLNPVNGFKMERVVAVEYGPCRRLFEVADPEAIRKRVNLINKYPVLLYIQSQREREVPIFQVVPQQSDYVVMWQESSFGTPLSSGKQSPQYVEKLKLFLIERLPRFARMLEAYKYSSWNRNFSFRDRHAFRRVR